jgi:hypothetical protein
MWAPPALLDIQRPNRSLAFRNLDADQRAVKAIRPEVQVLGPPSSRNAVRHHSVTVSGIAWNTQLDHRLQ